jgi:segregation and condensation protein A
VSESRASQPEEGAAELSPADGFRIALPSFEGPLDLLLHLIKEHKLDIFDIPIALIAEKYVEYLAKMREINLDIAGEFLVMASTLAHIKSRLLLPRQDVPIDPEAQEEGADPRAELVRRLLDYQKYKAAALQLATYPILDRDVFTRKVAPEAVPIPEEEVGFVEISIYKLIEALDRVLQTAAPELQHEVIRERISLTEAIHSLADRLREGGSLSFYSLFEGFKQRAQIVVTFLAILEMCKLKLIRVIQGEDGDITVMPKGEALSQLSDSEVDDEYK